MMYIAPEVHRGEHFDERSDVYSFSIVMWEMVTNKVLICCLCIVFQEIGRAHV
jgi:serine/threonine protein kinase